MKNLLLKIVVFILFQNSSVIAQNMDAKNSLDDLLGSSDHLIYIIKSGTISRITNSNGLVTGIAGSKFTSPVEMKDHLSNFYEFIEGSDFAKCHLQKAEIQPDMVKALGIDMVVEHPKGDKQSGNQEKKIDKTFKIPYKAYSQLQSINMAFIYATMTGGLLTMVVGEDTTQNSAENNAKILNKYIKDLYEKSKFGVMYLNFGDTDINSSKEDTDENTDKLYSINLFPLIDHQLTKSGIFNLKFVGTISSKDVMEDMNKSKNISEFSSNVTLGDMKKQNDELENKQLISKAGKGGIDNAFNMVKNFGSLYSSGSKISYYDKIEYNFILEIKRVPDTEEDKVAKQMIKAFLENGSLPK